MLTAVSHSTLSVVGYKLYTGYQIWTRDIFCHLRVLWKKVERVYCLGALSVKSSMFYTLCHLLTRDTVCRRSVEREKIEHVCLSGRGSADARHVLPGMHIADNEERGREEERCWLCNALEPGKSRLPGYSTTIVNCPIYSKVRQWTAVLLPRFVELMGLSGVQTYPG